MTTATKVSTCVDCATPIIGERLRCTACHQEHVALLTAASLGDERGDEDMTVPRARDTEESGPGLLFVRWMAVFELFAIVALGLVLCVRGCV